MGIAAEAHEDGHDSRPRSLTLLGRGVRVSPSLSALAQEIAAGDNIDVTAKSELESLNVGMITTSLHFIRTLGVKFPFKIFFFPGPFFGRQ